MNREFRLLAAAALLMVGFVAGAQEVPATASPVTSDRPPLELKGIKLGDGLDSVKAVFPEISCKAYVHPSAVQCYQKPGFTIGGKPARFKVWLLEGVVVRVAALGMELDDAYAVMDGLTVKYGQPDGMPTRRFTVKTARRDDNVGLKVPYWEADGRNHLLVIEPTNTYIEREKSTFAAVTLTDQNLMTQFEAREAGNADTSDL